MKQLNKKFKESLGATIHDFRGGGWGWCCTFIHAFHDDKGKANAIFIGRGLKQHDFVHLNSGGKNGCIFKILEVKYESNPPDFATTIIELVGVPDDFDFESEEVGIN